ncbi:DUF4054 domain-containing protein [Desemzia sp. C1]|uniref:DUF4054 domain-containing protein n=1 Tax=Desemzia sp. C1 TaxID=2892016 RepID=UPI001E60CDD0|nr:DUF4054 domain-containing protein [Desemzia sp. C1]MCI3027692.1 DUF4054 domain-containing protein [Desemzia sp. C1]
MKTTVQKLKVFADLAAMNDVSLEMYIDDAYLSVKSKSFPEEYEEMANRYLAAHLATMSNKHVVAEAVGTLKREYSDKNTLSEGLASTVYGQKYQELEKEFAKNKAKKGISLVVI